MTKRKHMPLPVKVVVEIILACLFVIPVYLFVSAGHSTLPGRDDPPAVASVPNIAIPNYNDAVPVLIYHDIADRSGQFTVTPQHFADQMAALHAQGFHSITIRQFLAFEHGGTLPNKPFLLTFDDGLGSFWRNADPIMKKYGFHGVAFVISGQIGKHGYYYMHPSELHALIQSGRWDVEAHTHLAHNFIKISPTQWGPALANRAWLPLQHRNENLQEYYTRIRDDLDLNIEELRTDGANPIAFAYPFSAAGAPSNDHRVFDLLNNLVAQRFVVSFVDNAGQRFITRYDSAHPQTLPRLEVYQSTTAARLLGRIKELVPIPPHITGLPAIGWFSEGTNRGIEGLVHTTHAASDLIPQRPGRKWFATYYLPARTELWLNYETTVEIGNLGSPKSGAAGTLLVGVAGLHGYAVTLSNNRITIRSQVGNHRYWYGNLPIAASSHRLSVTFTDHLRVVVDGHLLKILPVDKKTHGGIGFGTWHTQPHSPIPTFSDLSVHET